MSESLREQLAANFDTITEASAQEPAPAPATAPVEAPTPAEATPTHAEAPKAASEPAKAGRTAGRARDEAGRLLPGAAKREEPKAPLGAAPQQQAQPAAPARPAIARPSTWKKDHWESFDKLAAENPALAEYINQREGEYAKGVSTYKQEWDRARPVLDAIAPFAQDIAASGMPAEQHIARLFNAHKTLAMGSPEQRLAMFSRLAQDYQVPLASLVKQAPDGTWQMQAPAASAQPQFDPQQIQKMIDQRVQASLTTSRTEQDIAAFAAQKDKYPHFDEVRETMAGLLQAGLAQGLEDAYEASLRHPKHAALYEAQQQQQRAAEEKRSAEERARASQAARQKAVSPRTQTPTGAGGKAGGTGLRATIEAAFDEKVASRV